MSRHSGCLFSLFGNEGGEDVESRLPYYQQERLLSQAELSFYRVLLQAIDMMKLPAMVCPKVGLKDVFRVVTQDNAEYMAYTNKIDRKHVDFLLVDPEGMRLIAGIELDDWSHQTERGAARDLFVEKVYAAAGLPLLRFRAQRAYDVPDMVRYMREELGLQEAASPVRRELAGEQNRDAEAPSPRQGLAGKEPIPATVEETAATGPAEPPVCPKCGAPMVLRVAHRGRRKGERFWGCSQFPQCGAILTPDEGR